METEDRAMGQIEEQSHRLSMGTSDLLDIVALIEKRLQPILTNADETLSGTAVDEISKNPDMAPLASKLNSDNNAIRSAVARLNSLDRRIQL